MYTCCLAYADEDEGMAQIITDLYTKASPGSLFFRPQWDLKHGKYVYDTTARVIEERFVRFWGEVDWLASWLVVDEWVGRWLGWCKLFYC